MNSRKQTFFAVWGVVAFIALTLVLCVKSHATEVVPADVVPMCIPETTCIFMFCDGFEDFPNEWAACGIRNEDVIFGGGGE